MFFLSEIGKLYKLNQSTDNMHETEKCIKTLNLICEFSGIVTSNKYGADDHSSIDIRQITKVLSYIDNNYNCKITLKDLCRLSNMSRSTLLSQFHTLCNCSPTEYMQSVRIDNAKKMLADSDLSIATIAQECGFYDSSHFTKAFSKRPICCPKIIAAPIRKSAPSIQTPSSFPASERGRLFEFMPRFPQDRCR